MTTENPFALIVPDPDEISGEVEAKLELKILD